ncbi:MAG: ferredoxin family protein [Candidatus Shapirobacteria bacterium]
MNNNKTKSWNGIPREKINWHPTIDKTKCIQCLSCVAFCKQGVYTEEDGQPKVVNPLNCVVGCTGCQKTCPVKAISHPFKEYLLKLTGQSNIEAGCSSATKSCCTK